MTLKEWLLESGTTQQDLATKLDKSRTTICHLAAGDVRPSLSLALMIQAATGGMVKVNEWAPRRDGKAALKARR